MVTFPTLYLVTIVTSPTLYLITMVTSLTLYLVTMVTSPTLYLVTMVTSPILYLVSMGVNTRPTITYVDVCRFCCRFSYFCYHRLVFFTSVKFNIANFNDFIKHSRKVILQN